MKHSELKKLIKEEIQKEISSRMQKGLEDILFGKYSTRKAPKDTTDEESPDYDLYMGNDDPEYRRFYMALKRLVEKSSKKLDKNYEILEWIETLLDHMRPDKKG